MIFRILIGFLGLGLALSFSALSTKKFDTASAQRVAVKHGIATIVIAQLLSISSPAIAAVGEGDLPDGAMAFAKVQKYQKEWDKLAESVKKRGAADVDEKEIISIKFFLKQLANEYFDMELLGKGIPDTEKSKQALLLAKDFKQKIREIDDSASKSSVAGVDKILENYPVTSKDLKDFFDLMQDVPDEL